MQFSQIKIDNLFTYYNQTTFDFNDSSQPIALIIGENGFGKTSFINSIKIALHGITKDLLSIGDLVLSKQDYILGNRDKNFSGIINRVSKNGISLEFTDKAIDLIAREAYDPQLGARPVKRYIQKLVLNQLSKQLLLEEFQENDKIVVDENKGKLLMKKVN